VPGTPSVPDSRARIITNARGSEAMQPR